MSDEDCRWKEVSKLRHLLVTKRRLVAQRIEEGYEIMQNLLCSRDREDVGSPALFDKLCQVVESTKNDVLQEKHIRQFEQFADDELCDISY